MTFSPETTEALAQLRVYASRYPTMGVSEAINALDNAGVFAALDEQTGYADAVDILAESAIRDTERDAGLDPEEWGDLTRADLARHQTDEARQYLVGLREESRADHRGLTGTGHDRSACDADPLASPSQHSGACPTWARHHNL